MAEEEEEEVYVRLEDQPDEEVALRSEQQVQNGRAIGSRIGRLVSRRESGMSTISGVSYSCDSGSIISSGLALSSSLGWRLREEWDLLKRQWGIFLLDVFVLVYGTMFLFLNLAFYRFPVEDKALKDLGHEIIPKLPKDFEDSGIVDLPLNIILICSGVLLMSLFVNNASAGKRNPKPNFINVVIRGGTVYAIGHTLRACTYLSTSPPGASARCLTGGHPERFKPTLAECFYTAGDVYHNCGDLMFSGHMMLCLVLTLTIYQYGESAFWISKKQNNILVAACFLLCVIESFLIIAARHHYTADVVVAWYVTPLLYYYFCTAVKPRDLKPDLEGIALRLVKEHQERQRSPPA